MQDKTIGQQVKNSNLPIDVKPTKQAIHIRTGKKTRKHLAVSESLHIFAMPNSSNTTAKYIDHYAIGVPLRGFSSELLLFGDIRGGAPSLYILTYCFS